MGKANQVCRVVELASAENFASENEKLWTKDELLDVDSVTVILSSIISQRWCRLAIFSVNSAYNISTHAEEKTGLKNVELGRSEDNGEAAQFLENLTKMMGTMVYQKEARSVREPDDVLPKNN